MRVRLTRIKSTHDRMRTPSIEGQLLSEVELEEPLIIKAEALDPDLVGGVRIFQTTPVIEMWIDGPGRLPITLVTKNSTYKLEYLDEV